MKISTFVFHYFHLLFSISINFQTPNLLYLSVYLFILNSQSYPFLCLSVWICMALFYTTKWEAHFVITCKCIQAQDKKERNSYRTYTCRVLLRGGQKKGWEDRTVYFTSCPFFTQTVTYYLFCSYRLIGWYIVLHKPNKSNNWQSQFCVPNFLKILSTTFFEDSD